MSVFGWHIHVVRLAEYLNDTVHNLMSKSALDVLPFLLVMEADYKLREKQMKESYGKH